MAIDVFKIEFDSVIESHFIMASTNYDYAISHLSKLIEKLSIQRNLQKSAIYKRLETDIKLGCIMPPITVAFIDSKTGFRDQSEAKSYIEENIASAFILDGIQRLNVLSNNVKDLDEKLRENGFIVLNVLICPSMDKLLYRMVTLNNGQKPMTPAHQIEILTTNNESFQELAGKISTEKEGYTKDTLNKSNLVKAYVAFLGRTINIDNQKIIQSKLDELIAENIIESFDYNSKRIEFKDVIGLISSFSKDSDLFEWFKVSNNLIGFSVGIHKSYEHIRLVRPELLKENLKKLETVFLNIDKSKIKVSTYRRNLIKNFIENYEYLADKSENKILDFLTAL